MGERGIGPKSLVERTLRAWLLLSCVLCDAWCVLLIGPLSGVPCFPFYRPTGSMDYRWEKEENQRQRKSLEGAGSSFSSEPALLTRQMVLGIAPCQASVR